MKPNSNCFSLRPATREEASLFYSDDQTDRSLGTVGHVRMDFGSSGKGFYHTWWPHNGDRFNTPEFKEALQQFVDAVREDGPLKDLPSMGQFCRQNGGAITEDGRSYGYLAEMGDYRFCLRCTIWSMTCMGRRTPDRWRITLPAMARRWEGSRCDHTEQTAGAALRPEQRGAPGVWPGDHPLPHPRHGI